MIRSNDPCLKISTKDKQGIRQWRDNESHIMHVNHSSSNYGKEGEQNKDKMDEISWISEFSIEESEWEKRGISNRSLYFWFMLQLQVVSKPVF